MMSDQKMNGSEIIIKALINEGVDTVFGYPGGAVLPIYDAIFQQNQLRHVLVRQEGGAVQQRPQAGEQQQHVRFRAGDSWQLWSGIGDV